MKNLLVLTSQVIDDRNFYRFSLDYAHKIGFLTILDLTSLIYPKVFKAQEKIQKTGLNVVQIQNKNELKKFFLTLDSYDFIISILGKLNQDNFYIYSKLKNYRNKIIILALSTFPNKSFKKKLGPIKRIIHKYNREHSLHGIIKNIIFILNTKLCFWKITKASYIIVCAREVSRNFNSFIDKRTNIIPSCSYDFILSKKKQVKKIKSQYFLFLDEDLIYHTDFISRNEIVENEEIYYEELNSFFLYLKKIFNVEIIIAAHPRANINHTKNKFPKFKVYQNDTVNLVKYSKACITSASTSSNFAVIFHKPIIFITTNRMKKTRPAIEILANNFLKNSLNISQTINIDHLKKFFLIDNGIYDNFFYNFISCSKNPKFGLVSIEKELEGNEIK